MFAPYLKLINAIFGGSIRHLFTTETEVKLIASVEEGLSQLSEHEVDILRRRFGIGREAQTLKVAGQELGKSPERVRQVEKRAIRKLRYPGRIKKLSAELYEMGLLDTWHEEMYKTHISWEKVQVIANTRPLTDDELASIIIDGLVLSVRTANALKNEGITNLLELKKYSWKELLRLTYFGRKSLRELEQIISKFGVHLD